MHTRQVTEPAAGSQVHSARPPLVYVTFPPGAIPQRLYSMRGTVR